MSNLHVPVWNGKPLDQYTKEELIDIVVDMGRLLQEERTDASRLANLLALRFERDRARVS